VPQLIFRIRRSEHITPALPHQPSLAARSRTYLLQTGSYDVSIHPRHLSVLPTVVFHPCYRYNIQTTAAVFYVSSSGSSARSSLYGVAWWHSGYGVGLATGGRGFSPSRCTVECNFGQVVHTHCPAPLVLQPYGAI